MIGASLYIIVCSARNRLRIRLRRLREPRYLIGAIVGLAYVYFSFFARFRTGAGASRRRARAGRPPESLGTLLAAGPAFAGLGVMVLAAGSWILPFDSGLLEFSEAEMQFLFPAPVSRRQLLIHRMLRSQLGMLFGAVIIGLSVGVSVSGFSRLRISLAAWVLLATAKLYFTGVTLARVRLGAADRRIRRVAWLPAGILILALSFVGGSLFRAYAQERPDGALAMVEFVGRTAQAGWTHVVLWPFVAVARPLFAEWPQAYLISLAGSLAILLAMAAWVLLSDEAFQEAVAGVAERRSQEPAKKKGAPTYKVRSTGWALAPSGRPEAAFAWKAAMQTLRMVDRRALARVGFILLALTIIAVSAGQASGLGPLLGAFSLAGSGFSVLLAPQVLRIDMRQDLSHLELLKTWPIKASAVVRGELLWPGAMITGGAWMMIAMATALSSTILTHASFGLRMSGGAAAAILAPALVFSQLTIHNAIALLFPAWVPLGNQRPRGLDAMGQRLIMLGGTWLLLIIAALPGAIAGGVFWFALQRFIGHAALVPAALVAAMVVAVEVLLATEAIGPAYDRLDILAVERPE